MLAAEQTAGDTCCVMMTDRRIDQRGWIRGGMTRETRERGTKTGPPGVVQQSRQVVLSGPGIGEFGGDEADRVVYAGCRIGMGGCRFRVT